jgi:AraC family transcriptional regulator
MCWQRRGPGRSNRAGQRHETRPCTGAFCPAPIGVDNQIVVTAPVPRTLHLCLPTRQFRKLADDFNLPGATGHSIHYVTGAQDEVIHQIGRSIISVITNETAACRMFVEHWPRVSFQNTATAEPASPWSRRRIASIMRDSAARWTTYQPTWMRTSRRPNWRKSPASACSILPARSPGPWGVPPSRCGSRMRVERAMADIAAGKLPLAEIAFKAGFSSQARFTRAFYRVTGVTPGEYRAYRRPAAWTTRSARPLKKIASTDKTDLGDTPNIDHAHHPRRDMQD